MLEAERKLAVHLQIVMHDWPREAKQNTIDHVLAALAEQRVTERDACATIAETWGQREPELTDTAFIPGADHGERYASAGIAAAIRNRT